MVFQDKLIQCFDCETIFTFDVLEQKQFASKGHNHNPKRCPSCRHERKTRQNGNNVSSNRGNSYSPSRQMYQIKCSACDKDTQVPFCPREDHPIYCRDCYNKVRLSR